MPLRSFDLLWHDRAYKRKNRIEIEVTTDAGRIPLEFRAQTDLQIFARPAKDAEREVLLKSKYFPLCVFVPPLSGLDIDEPVLQQPRIDQLVGFGKPGDILRNLLVEAAYEPEAWRRLAAAVKDIFGYELLSPIATGPLIAAEYRQREGGPAFDVKTAGNGFLQILLLLAFMCTKEDTALLLDAPDTHLHMIPQDAIFSMLKRLAAERNIQLLIATHSQGIINSAEPGELCSLASRPKRLADSNEKSALIETLSVPNADILLAREKGRILYTERYVDLVILQAWAEILDHKIKDFLRLPLWRPATYKIRRNAPGVPSRNHFSIHVVKQPVKAAPRGRVRA